MRKHRTSNIEHRTSKVSARRAEEHSVFDVRCSAFDVSAHRRTSAFTLLEVMLAVVVCAVVLVAINTIFFTALRLRSRVSDRLAESLPVERALSLLRSDLKNAVPPGGLLSGPLQSGGISGGLGMGLTDDTGIQIYTATGNLTADAPWGDIQKVTYQLHAPADAFAHGKELIRSVTRNLLPTVTEESEEQWLASGVEQLQFSYYDGANWLDTWDATMQTNLPQAVRVSVLLATDAQAPHPEPLQLLVPLVAQTRTNSVQTSTNGGTL